MTTESEPAQEPTQEQLWDCWSARLKAARKAQGISQEELADKARISQATVSAIENGRYGGSALTQLAIERVLGLPNLFSRRLDDEDEQVAS